MLFRMQFYMRYYQYFIELLAASADIKEKKKGQPPLKTIWGAIGAP